MSRKKWFLTGMIAFGVTVAAFASGRVAMTPKGYLIAEVTVTDTEAYKDYAAKASLAITDCGGKYLARGGKVEGLEGARPAPRFVIVEFKSFDQAKACYSSKAYQAAAAIRQKASKSRFWLSEGLPV